MNEFNLLNDSATTKIELELKSTNDTHNGSSRKCD